MSRRPTLSRQGGIGRPVKKREGKRKILEVAFSLAALRHTYYTADEASEMVGVLGVLA